jgi:hypothetical protein
MSESGQSRSGEFRDKSESSIAKPLQKTRRATSRLIDVYLHRGVAAMQRCRLNPAT